MSLHLNSDQDKASILNNTFTNSFNRSIPGIGHGDLPDVALVDCPTEFLCTEDEVYELLSNLDITKANGPDISARMLKETALSITPIVTHLFNVSIPYSKIRRPLRPQKLSINFIAFSTEQTP